MSEIEFSPSFMYDGPGNTVMISCATCRACKNYDIVVAEGSGYLVCKALKTIPDNILQQKTYQCDHFLPDTKSRDYDMVMKQLENEKKLT